MAYHVCDSFDVTVALKLMRMFRAKKVLDFCAGWGDRLIAAIAGGMAYTGVDINREVFPGYRATIDALVHPVDRSRYVMVNGAAETAIVEGVFDLVFTSPPYFSSEVYSTDANNQNSHDDDVQTWLCRFMFPALRNAWAHIADGGHMLIALGDAWDERGVPIPYTECVNLHIGATLPSSVYVGCIAFRYPYRKRSRVNPVWVWKKTSTPTGESLLRYQSALVQHYQHVLDACPKELVVGGKKCSSQGLRDVKPTRPTAEGLQSRAARA